MIAALFVDPCGPYAQRSGVDAWPESRDARTYPGPHPVVAHPPCERWGRFWKGWPNRGPAKVLGDDGGCFTAALEAVRRFGGVLEHPAISRAWKANGLTQPPKEGGWIPAGDGVGWTCHVEQGHYGHFAPKPTWLYAVVDTPPSLRWGPSGATGRVEKVWSSDPRRWRTPEAFMDLLIEIATS